MAGFTSWCPGPVTVRPAPCGRTSGSFPFARPATFVTADNPHGRVVADAVNAARRASLTKWLDSAGRDWHPAVGGDPEGDHLEPGALVLGLDLGAAAELGARFDQAAVYVWTRDALHLVSCAGDRHDVLGFTATATTRLRPPPFPGRRQPR